MQPATTRLWDRSFSPESGELEAADAHVEFDLPGSGNRYGETFDNPAAVGFVGVPPDRFDTKGARSDRDGDRLRIFGRAMNVHDGDVNGDWPGLRTLLGGVRRRVARDRAVAGQPAERALVETFTRQEIAGWLLVPPDTPECRVALCLNDVAATEVVAHPEPGTADGLQRRRFRFVLYDFWRFARTTDTVSVR
jgi:predicted secreted protein